MNKPPPDKVEEFRGYLKINKAHLDDELVQQPSLFEEISEACTQAIAERDAAKEDLATVDAELDDKIRRDVKKAEGRATDSMVAKAVQRHPDHAKAFDHYLDTKLRADKFLGLKESFIQRNYAIRDLCGLYVAGYFETTSFQGTSATDRHVYDNRRKVMAEARRTRLK